MVMRTTVFFLTTIICFLSVSCSRQLLHSDNGPDEYSKNLKNGEYYRAYLIIDAVLEKCKHEPEGVAGYAYQQLVSRTASVGEKDWGRILKDPNISLDHKRCLVEEIHENALRGLGR